MSRWNSYASCVEDIEAIAACEGLDELLLEPAALAYQGRLPLEALVELAAEARQRGLRAVVVWDLLMPERQMEALCPQLLEWPWSAFDALRLTDPGAAWWAMENLDLPLQLDVQGNSHNLHALQGWCQLFQDRLERLILSIELPEEKLLEYCQQLPVACEVLAAGRIPLFYSPRSLLAGPLGSEASHLETTIASEASHMRAFPLMETPHGTSMYLDRDQFILDRREGLEQAGMAYLRLDLRHLGEAPRCCDALGWVWPGLQDDPAALRSRWPRQTRAPFFKVNKTTAQFSRMRSKAHDLRDRRCVAKVLAIENGGYMVAQALRDFDASKIESLMLPKGDVLPWSEGHQPRDLEGRPLEQVRAGQVLLLAWRKMACPGALLREA